MIAAGLKMGTVTIYFLLAAAGQRPFDKLRVRGVGCGMCLILSLSKDGAVARQDK